MFPSFRNRSMTNYPRQSPGVTAPPAIIKPMPSQIMDLSEYDSLKFIMLDSFVFESNPIQDDISGTYRWEICRTDTIYCLNYIRNECRRKRVFLISSGSQGCEIVPNIHDLPQVYAIYIYCADIERHNRWASKYSKVRIVCDDEKVLLPQFAVDVAQVHIEWGDALNRQDKKLLALEKYKKALQNLSEYSDNRYDILMEKEIHHKIDDCKNC